MGPFLARLNRHASPLLAGALFVGIAVPPLSSLARPLLAGSVVALLAAVLLRIDWRRVAAMRHAPLTAIAAIAWMMIGCPVLVHVALLTAPIPDSVKTIIVLMASSPTLIAVPAFALMVGADAALALVVMVATSFLLPLIQPPLVLALLGLDLHIGLATLMGRLGFLVGSAAALAALVRTLAGGARVQSWDQEIGGVAVLALIVFGLGVVDGLLWVIIDDPRRVALFTLLAFIANYGLQMIGALTFWPAGRVAALTVGLGSGNRNLAILVAVLADQAPPELSLWLACGQFPMYLFPVAIGPLYRRLLRPA